MGFKGFLDRLLSGKKTSAEMARLQKMRKIDLDVAIAAHKNWRYRLEAVLEGSEGQPPRPDQISCDKSCDLGKWIYGEGEQAFGDLAAFVELRATHQMFHYSASNVLTLALSNKRVEARKLMEDEFDTLSRRIELSLTDLKHGLQG